MVVKSRPEDFTEPARRRKVAWQDIFFTGGNVVLSLGLIPLILHGPTPPTITSLSAALAMMVIAIANGSLNYPISTLAASLSCLGWLILFLQRSI